MLSEDELQLVQNRNLILTKNAIIQKVYAMFGNIALELQSYTGLNAQALPFNCSHILPKISKGEKYEEMPYVILDYPRVFSKKDIFAVRNLFWWGNYFSTTLHVRGQYATHVSQKLLENLETLVVKNVHISTEGDEWAHNICHKDYTLLNNLSRTALQMLLEKNSFIKLTIPHSLKEWSTAEKHLETISKELLRLAQKS